MTPRPARPPGYWMHETGGELAPAVMAYLEGDSLTVRQVALIRAYFRQWIYSDVWDLNPRLGDDGRGILAGLRSDVARLLSRKCIDAWVARAVEFGLDPL